MTPEDRKYSKDHEWAQISDSVATVGITEFAAESLGDVVFVDMPDVGTVLTQGEKYGDIESIKTVSDLIAPVSGVVVEINDSATSNPDVVNEDPYGRGWLMRVQITDKDQLNILIDASAYDAQVAF